MTKAKLQTTAKFAGLIWILAVFTAGAILIANNLLQATRASMVLLFFACFPGAFLIRYARKNTPIKNLEVDMLRRRRSAPLEQPSIRIGEQS